jgi:hypothetical protein
MQQRFASFSGIVHKLEETHIPPNYVVNGWDGYAETA